MSEGANQISYTVNTDSSKRFVGIIAIAYSLSIMVQNGLFGGDAPTYSTPISDVLTYHAENQSILAITSGLEALNMVLLLVFVTALHGLVQRRGGKGSDWSLLAVAAGSTLSALFALTIATHIAVITAARSLSEASAAFEIMWQLHAACLALAMPALGVTFISVALATHASGLTKSWQRALGIVGGNAAIIAGLGNLAIVGGSPILFIGVFGLFTWIIWMITTGVRLLRV